MTILLHRAVKVGDNVVAIKAIYAIKAAFPHAHLIVATNGIGENLYRFLPFIDELINLETTPITQKIDIFIITHRTTQNIDFALRTNAPKIIVRAHLRTIFRPRFVNDYNFTTKFRTESQNLLRLVRLIDKKRFERAKIDFNNARIPVSAENEAFAVRFLESLKPLESRVDSMESTYFTSGGGQQESSADSTESCADSLDSRAGKLAPSRLIGVNFFGSNADKHFAPEIWREIVESLAREFPQNRFIILTHKSHALARFGARNVEIFANDDDLLNLVALTARLHLLISIDTGNVHIADNLRVPTLEIMFENMHPRWCGGTYGGRFWAFVMPLKYDANTQKARLLDFARGIIAQI